MKYLVDTMRNNNIVWGVGRGSSVGSFVLYKIGINRINPNLLQIRLPRLFKLIYTYITGEQTWHKNAITNSIWQEH